MSDAARRSPTSTERVTVPSSYVRALATRLAGEDADVAAYLATESLSEAELERVDTVSAERFAHLYRRAMDLLDDESLGMLATSPAPRGTFRMSCLAAIGCATLGGVIERIGEFVELARGPGVRPRPVRAGDEARVEVAVVAHAGRPLEALLGTPQGPLELRTTLYFWANLLGWFAARPLPLARVELGIAGAAGGEDWPRLFGAPVAFGAARSALVLPARALALPNVQSTRTLESFLEETPHRLVVPSFLPPSTAERLRALLGARPGEAPPTADDAARVLGLSPSTLRRRLAAEGTSWRALKDASRRDVALRYVVDTDLPFAEIAALLGFDEPSTFFRAFRRWTGTTPTRYRARETS